MSTRVSPEETQLEDTNSCMDMTHKEPSMISAGMVNERGLVAIPKNNHGTEDMFTVIDGIYSPVLKIMKLLGIYYGETSLSKLSYGSSTGSRKVSISLLYCCVVIASLWFNFAMAFISLCMEGVSVLATFYTLTGYSLWSLNGALTGTVCMITVALPLTDRKTSRFEIFLRNVVKHKANLERVQILSRKGLIQTAPVFVVATSSLIIGFFHTPELVITTYKPWDDTYALKIFSLVSVIYTGGVWVFPSVLFSATCLVLERLFDGFYEKLATVNSNVTDFSAIKEEHRKLCETVELASNLFSPLLLGLMSLYIPLLCFEFYIIIHPPLQIDENSVILFVLGNLFWLVGSAVILAQVMRFGSKVNEKVSS